MRNLNTWLIVILLVWLLWVARSFKPGEQGQTA